MTFLLEYAEYILPVLIFIGGGVSALFRWRKLSAQKRYDQLRGWLLQAVVLAEREYGSGTGRMKLSTVYDKFCERFPWLAKVITFDKFSGYVDDALGEMSSMLQNNTALASIVEKEEATK